MKTKTIINSAFAEEVKKGLTDFPKHLSSKYFYDSTGDKLFQDIMAMPSYYLTNSEFEILDTYKEGIGVRFNDDNGFDLIELGAGDGKKTKILLKHFVHKGYTFDFLPIDISQNALNGLKATIKKEIPEVTVKPQQGTYFEVLKELKTYNSRKKVIMVLGSNIGNLLHPQAIEFLQELRSAMNPKDILFMGFDQKKHPQTVLNAYNDDEGITAAFNKNILQRINKEFEGDFNLANFLHWEVYDPETGTAKSYLVSKVEQKVNIKSLDLNISFEQWETIHTEISQKYDPNVIKWLADESGLKIIDRYNDHKNFYSNYLFMKKN